MSIYAPLNKYAPLYAFNKCSLDESSWPLMRSNSSAPSLYLTRSLHTSCCVLDALPLIHEKNQLSPDNNRPPSSTQTSRKKGSHVHVVYVTRPQQHFSLDRFMLYHFKQFPAVRADACSQMFPQLCLVKGEVSD